MATIGCSETNYVQAKLEKGVLDLRTLPFDENHRIELDGEWKFFYEKFLNPALSDTLSMEPDTYINVPESWQGKEISGRILPRSGYATFQMHLFLSEEARQEEWRILIPDIASSYRFYIDGVLVSQMGEPSSDPALDESKIKRRLITFSPKRERTEFLFHISNYENNFGGFWEIPVLAPKGILERDNVIGTARELFLLGALLIMGLYHFGLFYFRQKEKPILFFATFCLLIGIRVGLTGSRYFLEVYPNFPWGMAFRLEFASYYFATTSFLLFIHYLFHEDSNKRIVKLLVFLTIPFYFSLLFPTSYYTYLVFGYQALSFSIILYSLYLNGKAIKNKRENAYLFLFGVGILASGVAYDIIQHSSNLRALSLTPYALLCFIFTQALILSNRIANAFSNSEHLTDSLRISNESLTALTESLETKVEERTSELNKTLQRLKKDLTIAKRIQSKILPDPSLEFPELKVSVYFFPRDEVGGDFYDYFLVQEGVIRLFLADATGHGIQAGLYTMAIKSEYESIKRILTKTDDLLKHLNTKIQTKFMGLKMVFSCIVIDLDLNKGKLYYSSAGHLKQVFFHNGKPLALERSGNIIGLKRIQEFGHQELDFNPGDRIYLYTDGISEQKNEQRVEYGEDRILSVLQANLDESLEKSVGHLIGDLGEFQGNADQEDDESLLAVEWKKQPE